MLTMNVGGENHATCNYKLTRYWTCLYISCFGTVL